MSTLGDPLADLGILLVYWSEAGDGDERDMGSVVRSATALEGFPTRTEVAELYAGRTGLDLAALPWAVSFGFFKLAVVCAGIVARVRGGAMVGDHQRQLDIALAGALANPHPARGHSGDRLRQPPRPAIVERARRSEDDAAPQFVLRHACRQP